MISASENIKPLIVTPTAVKFSDLAVILSMSPHHVLLDMASDDV
jgi:hypothetical protein